MIILYMFGWMKDAIRPNLDDNNMIVNLEKAKGNYPKAHTLTTRILEWTTVGRRTSLPSWVDAWARV